MSLDVQNVSLDQTEQDDYKLLTYVLNGESCVVHLGLIKMYKESLFYNVWLGDKDAKSYNLTITDRVSYINNDGHKCYKRVLVSGEDCKTIITKMYQWSILDHLSVFTNKYLLMGQTPFLMKHQYMHTLEINNRFEVFKAAINASMMGSGKTYIAAMIARLRCVKLIVVGPKISETGWYDVASHFRVEIDFHSYGILSNTKKDKKSGLRVVPSIPTLKNVCTGFDEDGDPIHTIVGSDSFVRDISNGVLIVFDECHNLKNSKSIRSKRASIMLGYVYGSVKSRALFMSGTIFDKVEHAETVIGLMGLGNSPEEVVPNFERVRSICASSSRKQKDTKMDNLPGELYIEACAKKFKECVPLHHYPKANTGIIRNGVMIYCDDMKYMYWYNYVNTISKYLTFVMPYTLDHIRHRVSDAIVALDEDDQEILNQTFEDYNTLTEMMNSSSKNGGNLLRLANVIHQRLEDAKTLNMCRLADKYLKCNPRGKVILCLSYVSNIERATELLKTTYGHTCESIYGKVSIRKRPDIIDRFQRGGTNVLVINPTTCGVAIDLDAKDQDGERLMLFSPSWRFIEITQTMNRIMRASTKGKAGIVFVYSENINAELNMIENLSKKRNVLIRTFGKKAHNVTPSEGFGVISLDNIGNFFDNVK